jgi:dienelactone hydrolase
VLRQDAVEAAAEHDPAALHGSSPDVGVVGYSLGGGIGW